MRAPDHFDVADALRCRCGAVEPTPGDFIRCVDCALEGADTAVCASCRIEADPWGETYVCSACQDDREDRDGRSDVAVPFAANH